MTLWRITNNIHSSVSIEDIDVRLEPAGLPGATCVISESSFRSSADLARLRYAVTVSPAGPRPAAAPWPLSRPSDRQAATLPPPRPAAQPPAASSSEMADLRETVRGLEQVVRQLTSALQSVPAHPAFAQPVAQPAPAPPRPHASHDPVFIPSSILPDADTSHLRAHSGESDAADFDESASALKGARKRRPAR